MDHRVSELLRKHADEVDSKSSATHVIFFPTQKYFKISGNKKGDFWRDYCDIVYDDLDKPLCIGEIISDKAPFTVFLKMKFQCESNLNITNKFREEIVYHLQNAFDKILNMPLEDDNIYITTILESNVYSKKGYFIVDMRLHSPYCVTEKNEQYLIREVFIKNLRGANPQKHLGNGVGVYGDWNDFVSQISWEVPLYGSSHEHDGKFLNYVNTYGGLGIEEIELDTPDTECVTDPQCVYFINFHRDTEDDINILKDPYFLYNRYVEQDGKFYCDVDDDDFSLLYPFFFSLRYSKDIITTYAKSNDDRTSEVASTNNSECTSYQDDEHPKEISETLVKLLSKSRFESECYWFDIGRALYHSNSGGENGINVWIHYTEKHFKNRDYPYFMIKYGNLEATIRREYMKFGTSHITVKTLAWYAKKDSKDYGTWHSNWVNSLIDKTLSLTNNDVARAFYRAYWLEFMYVPSGNKGKWFQFCTNSSKWKETSDGIQVLKNISENFLKTFEVIRTKYANEVTRLGEHEKAKKDSYEYSIKQTTALITKLKNNAFKNSVLKECKEFFVNEEFLSLIDANENLTGVKNGIIEVTEQKAFFRGCKPEDYITMSTTIPYNDKLSYESPEVKELLKWFKEVFYDDELIAYYIKFCSSILKAGNHDKYFWIWTGDGHNSKSMLVKLFETAFEIYSAKTNVAALSDKASGAGNASPHIARLKNKRINFFDEPDGEVTLQKGTIKRITGGDTMYGRLLFENGGEIKATTKSILLCNAIPSMDGMDEATVNRLRVLPFNSKWCHDAPDSEEEQMKIRRFKMDKNFERKIPGMAAAFIWLCTNNYGKYINEGLKAPDCVNEASNKYWKDQDVYGQFIDDCTTKTDNGSKISITEVYERFKSWFRDNYPNKTVAQRPTFRTEMTNRWGRPKGTCWEGHKLLDDGEINDTDENYVKEKENVSINSNNSEVFGGTPMIY